MRLLLVEDDPMIGKSVQTWLKGQGYAVDWVRDGVAAELSVRDTAYDLVLLDLGLPRKSGHDVLTNLRASRHDVPVLVITARDAVPDRVKSLDAGADDYLVKPFDLDELSARVRALLRRQAGRSQPAIEHGPLRIDPSTRQVTFEGVAVNLSPREFALLLTLVESAGVPLSRAQLEEKVYGWGEEVESNAIEVHIHALRRKLGADLIRTVRGVGYLVGKIAR
ncbi:MAG: response regulator [Betaproteobacteria bacterium]